MAVKSLAQSSILQSTGNNSLLAGYESNYFHHLETVRLGGTAASVTFSNLQRYSDYQHLQFRIVTRSLRPLTDDSLQITFNNSGNTGAYHFMWGNGSSVSSAAGGSSEIQQIATYSLPAANSAANNFGAVIIDVLDPFETNKNTTMRAFAGKTGDTPVVSLSSLAWYNTAAVTSIKFDSRNGNNGFSQYSRFSLYGIKAR